MVNTNEIARAFSYSDTPHVVLSADMPYLVVNTNLAFCKWVNLAEEQFLQKDLFAEPNAFSYLTGITETKLIQLCESVNNTKVPIKVKVEPNAGPGDINYTNRETYLLEIYPLIENNEVMNLVVKVEPLHNIVSLETIASNCCNQGALSTYQLLPWILDSLANVIFVLDVESPGVYKFSFANRAFQVTTGVPVSRVVGSYVHQVIPEPSLSMVLEKYQEAIEQQKQVTWTEVSDYPTGQKTGEVAVIPVWDPGCNCWRLIGMVHDITQHVEAEAKQLRLTQDLYQHNRDLQQFTYIISHNLRAPVAYAIGLTKFMSGVDKTSKEFDASLTYLIESVTRLDDILKDLNLILSIRDRRDVLEMESVSLLEVCEQVITDLSEQLNQCQGLVSLEIESGTKVQAYRAFLYSVFHNLLSNAIKYRSDKRQLQVNIHTAKNAEGGTTVTFSDNGSGFDLKKAGSKVFQLYKRFHAHIEGKGIGLFLVKSHLEALGGQVEVFSQVDVGTKFIIYLK